MRERTGSTAPNIRPVAVAVDVVVCALEGHHLAVLLKADEGRSGHWALPWSPFVAGGSLEQAAGRCVARALGTSPSWMTQAAAFSGSFGHPGRAAVSIAFVAVTPETACRAGGRTQWFSTGSLPPLGARHGDIVAAALAKLRESLETSPVAFRLLPPTFTLAQLQKTYELLLDRRLHKASFRRSLQAAFLVEPLAEWRTEGRGRPAQVFRYSPRRGRAQHRGVRFVVMGGGTLPPEANR